MTEYDVLFLGNMYSEYRLQLARALKALPYKVGIFGRGYPEGLSNGESLYDFRKTGNLYRSAKIAIGDNQFTESTGFFSDRAFMALASGGCALFHQRVEKIQELTGITPGVHFVEWENFQDLAAKIAYYLEHEDERRAIADAGTRECRENHSFAKRVDQLKDLIKTIPKKKAGISALMIVKNESLNLKRCLEQLETFAAEIIIVDTGSIDGTPGVVTGQEGFQWGMHPDGAMVDDPGIVGTLGKVKLYEHEWVDFAEARNFAKSKCKEDWIFWLDGDDIIPPDTLTRLQNFETWSFRSIGVTQAGAYKMKVVDIRAGVRGMTGLQTRLFRNFERVEWRNPVHENVDESLNELGMTIVAMNGVEVHHVGTTNAQILKLKQERNLLLLDTLPDQPWKYYQKGVSYAALARWGDAIIWFEMAERASEDADLKSYVAFAAGYAFYSMGLKDLAAIKLSRSTFPDALYYLAEIEEEKAFNPELYRKAFKATPSALFPSYRDTWRPKARQKLLEWHRQELESLVV